MSRIVALIRKLRAAGIDEDTAHLAAELFEVEIEDALAGLMEEVRSKARARKAKQRAGECPAHAVTSRDVTGQGETKRDLTYERPQVVNTLSSSLRSEEVAVAAVVAREPADDWPDGGNKGHARLLIDRLASPWLDPNKSPDLITTAGRLAAWKRDGASWEHDVVPVVSGLVAKRRQRIGTWKFFDGAIAQSIADNRAALEIPEAEARPRGQGPPMGLTASIAAEHAEARRRVLES